MDRIVVGVDGSAAGRSALRWALREAVGRDVSVHAVRAWLAPSQDLYPAPGDALVLLDADAAAHAQVLAEQELKLAVDQVAGAERVDAHAVAVTGPAAQVLVNAGRGAAAVVVGDRGAGALSRAVLGSVSSSVLHHANCPVVVVPDDHGAVRDGRVRRVVVGVDHSAASLAALGAAVEQARRREAVLVPVCVHDPVWATPAEGTARLEQSEQRALMSAAEAAGAAGLDVQPEVLAGQAADGLVRLAQPDDLLVVGSRGRGGFAGLVLGSTSTQCSQHAVCPVIVVRSAAPAAP